MNRPVLSYTLALALLATAPLAQAQEAAAAPAPAIVDVAPAVDGTPVDGVPGAATQPSLDAAAIDPATASEPVATPQQAPMQAQSPPSAPDPRTAAEQDYDALYGASAQDYNPIADPTLPPPAELPASYDPWEKLNRKVHRFNNVVDRRIATPLA